MTRDWRAKVWPLAFAVDEWLHRRRLNGTYIGWRIQQPLCEWVDREALR